MTTEHLQAIEARCQRNQGRNDGMIRQDVMDLIAEVRRLRCCGNCESYQHKVKEEQINKHSCYVGNRLVEFISMPDPLPELICLGVDGSGKCEKWEAADNG